MLLAAPFMEHPQQLHAHQPARNFGKPSPGESAVEHEESTSDFILAGGGGDDDHGNHGSSTLPPSPSSPPQQHMLAPPDFPPSAAAAAAAVTSASSAAAGPPTRVVFPGRSADGNSFETISNSRPGGSGAAVFHPGFERASSYHYHHHRHHHHHQHLHYAANRQFGGGGGGPYGGGAHGGGGPHGEDDFEFLRTILLDAGSGTSHAAHNSALPTLGAAGYIPVSAAAAAAHAAVAATDAPFAPMSAAKSSLFSAVSSSPLGAHHPSPPSPSYVAAGGGGGGGGGGDGDGGSLSFGAAASGGSGRYGSGGNQAVEGPGGYRENGAGGYHVTEEERLQAADDVARCIWLAGDELREILLERLFDLWSTVEAEMVSYADGATGGGGGGGGAPRKSFNEVLVERLQATCQAVEAELKAAKARGDDTAFCNPPQHHWRGSGALRGDVLSRLEAYRRDNQANCGIPGSGHGRFSSLNCIDDFERANALARGGGGGGGNGGGRHRGGHAGGGLAADGAGDLRQGLETAIEATRGAVKSELLMFGDGEPVKRNAAAATAAAAAAHPARSSSKAGGADRRSAAAAAAVAAAAVAPTARGGGAAERKAGKRAPGAANKGGNKKRKRSGNGRRCKHEGCLLHPHFGLTRPEYCSKHKLPGMFNVKGRRCIHPDW
ncbi:unnamed protein product [Ectocarpus fasciculatus]